MDNVIMVSIICNAYNHERYIRTALDGFVMQRTDFSIEILVHDDASTDGTANIIREYAERYPDIILPIFQKENQYSQGVSITFDFQLPRARGKYVAFCEGDDYWTDPYKLQKQVDALERNPEINICTHRAATERNGIKTGEVPSLQTDTVFTAEEVIAGGGGFVNTATLMLRKSVFAEAYLFSKMMSSDYCSQILGSLNAGMLYLGDNMATYRQMTAGSWTATTYGNREKEEGHMNRVADMLRCLDKDTNYKYTEVIQKRIEQDMITILKNYNDYKGLLKEPYRAFYQSLSAKEKIKIQICARFPMLVTLRRKLKK